MTTFPQEQIRERWTGEEQERHTLSHPTSLSAQRQTVKVRRHCHIRNNQDYYGSRRSGQSIARVRRDTTTALGDKCGLSYVSASQNACAFAFCLCFRLHIWIRVKRLRSALDCLSTSVPVYLFFFLLCVLGASVFNEESLFNVFKSCPISGSL